MENKLHKNYKTASNLIFATLVLDPIEFFFSKYLGTTTDEIVVEILGMLFIALTAYAIRYGVTWVKYILLIITLLGMVAIILAVQSPAFSIASLLVTFLQVVLMSWALVLLFRIPPPSDEDTLDSEI